MSHAWPCQILQGLLVGFAATGGLALDEFSLGFYGPLTSVDQHFLAIIVAADLDIRKNWDPSLVTRFGPPIVSIPNLVSTLRFKVQTCDSSSTVEIGMGCALNMFQGQNGYEAINGLVGGYHSAISQPVASLATIFKMPQVSWASTSPTLSNKKNYPYFLRTIPPDSIQGAGMWKFIEHFLIPAAAFINAKEPYGSGLLQAVTDQATNAEQGFRISAFSILYMPGAGNYNPEEARPKVVLCKRSGLKFIFVGMTPDQFAGLAPVMKEEGLMDGQIQLIGSEAITAAAAPDYLMAGHIWFSPISRGPKWLDFEAMFKKMTVDDVGSAAARAYYKVDKYETPFDQARGGKLSADQFADPASLGMETPFIFDAAYAFFIAVNQMLSEGVAIQDIKGEALLTKVKAVAFEGLSGAVGFDKNGDRAASYEIWNLQPVASQARRLAANGGAQGVISAVYNAAAGTIVPESGRDLYWSTGHASWTLPMALASCDPGFWKDSEGANATRLCIECEPGTISAGGVVTRCDACPAGTRANAPRMATQCMNCTAGTVSSESKSTACSACSKGYFNAQDGATACDMCSVGSYSADEGSTGCASCSEGKQQRELYATMQQVEVNGIKEWVPFAGADSATQCGCIKNAYNKSGECESCGTGMRCAGMGEVLIEPSYFAWDDAPGFVFACYGSDSARCPGGAPGTCAAGRDASSLTCNNCRAGLKKGENGECVECGGIDTLPLLTAIVLGTVMMIVVYRVIDTSKPAAQTKSVLLVAIAGSQMVTMFQQLSVFGSISLEWSSPFSDLLEFVSLFNFKLDYLALDCVAAVPPLQKFAVRVFMVLIFFVFMVLVHVASVVILHKRQFRARMPALIGSIGTVFSAFFISIVASLLAPFQCHKHPNGMRTMMDYPSVVCWDDAPYGDGGHSEMVALAAVANLIPLVFLCGTCWVIWRLPGKLAGGDTEFLNSFKFLFFRFRAGAHWYVIVFLVRNLLVAIVPVLGEEVTQLLVLECIMVPMLILTVYVMPWSVTMANVLDAMNTTFLCILLFAFALFVEDVQAMLIAEVCVSLVVFAFAGIFVAVLFGVYERFLRSGKPFQFFLCHHKAGAGNFARLLKMALLNAPQVTKKVFVDSDDLRDLNQLFGVVCSDIDKLVVVCSKEILSRPWCMGEVTTAHCNSVKVVRVMLSDFSWPADDFIDKYETHVPDAMMLSQHGIGLDLLKEALHWLKTCPEMNLMAKVHSNSLKEVVHLLLKPPAEPSVVINESAGADETVSNWTSGTSKKSKSQGAPADAKNYIIANMANLESASAALVLSKLLVPLMQHHPEEIPQVLGDGELLPPSTCQICLICDNTVFTAEQIVQSLVFAAEENLKVLPVVTEASFRFPSKEFLITLAKTSDDMLQHIGSPYKGVVFARIVERIFKEIAVEVNPQDAVAALEVRARAVYTRLQGGLRGLDVALEADGDDKLQAQLSGKYVEEDTADEKWDEVDYDDFDAAVV